MLRTLWRRRAQTFLREGRRRLLAVTVASLMSVATAGVALAGLAGGSLPTSAVTYVADVDNEVNSVDGGIHLKVKGDVTAKTTYTMAAPGPGLVGGWHYHHGPVIVTVTTGTLTFYDAACNSWDLEAGHTYIESAGQILVARALPERNVGVASVAWFTTRLYPTEAGDSVSVAEPCVP